MKNSIAARPGLSFLYRRSEENIPCVPSHSCLRLEGTATAYHWNQSNHRPCLGERVPSDRSLALAPCPVRPAQPDQPGRPRWPPLARSPTGPGAAASDRRTGRGAARPVGLAGPTALPLFSFILFLLPFSFYLFSSLSRWTTKLAH
jgi:hypothetical protein